MKEVYVTYSMSVLKAIDMNSWVSFNLFFSSTIVLLYQAQQNRLVSPFPKPHKFTVENFMEFINDGLCSRDDACQHAAGPPITRCSCCLMKALKK